MALYCGENPKGKKAKSTMPKMKETRSTGRLECGIKKNASGMSTVKKSK